jgi:hypothetical protein
MVYYECLNFDLISIRLRGQTYLRGLFDVFWFCVSLSLKHETIFFLAIFFLKLCALWVHVSLAILDRFRIFSVNILVAILKSC